VIAPFSGVVFAEGIDSGGVSHRMEIYHFAESIAAK